MNGVLLEASTVSMETVIDAAGTVFDWGFTCLNVMLENPILLFLFAGGLVPFGVRVIKSLKGAAKF